LTTYRRSRRHPGTGADQTSRRSGQNLTRTRPPWAPAGSKRALTNGQAAEPGRPWRPSAQVTAWPSATPPGNEDTVMAGHDRWDAAHASLSGEVELRGFRQWPLLWTVHAEAEAGLQPSLQARLAAMSLADQVGQAPRIDELAGARADGSARRRSTAAAAHSFEAVASEGAAIVKAGRPRACPPCRDLPG
jgi:hypothetical protein